MEEKDQNQTLGVIVEDHIRSISRDKINGEKSLKDLIKSTKQPWYQRIARRIVLTIITFAAVSIIAGLSILYYSISRDTPLLFYANTYALHKGSIYALNKEKIILADDQKGFIEAVSYLNMDNQMLVTTRALGTGRYFAFAWVPKLDSFEGAYGLIDYNCDGQYTPMIIGGAMIIPACFRKILTDKIW